MLMYGILDIYNNLPHFFTVSKFTVKSNIQVSE